MQTLPSWLPIGITPKFGALRIGHHFCLGAEIWTKEDVWQKLYPMTNVGKNMIGKYRFNKTISNFMFNLEHFFGFRKKYS